MDYSLLIALVLYGHMLILRIQCPRGHFKCLPEFKCIPPFQTTPDKQDKTQSAVQRAMNDAIRQDYGKDIATGEEVVQLLS